MHRPLAFALTLVAAALLLNLIIRPQPAIAAPADGEGRWRIVSVAPGGGSPGNGYAILVDSFTGDTWSNFNVTTTWQKMSR